MNEAYRYRAAGGGDAATLHTLCRTLLLLLAPMAPFLTEDEWRRMGFGGSVHDQPWPTFDPLLAAEDEVTMIVQVNGKVRATIPVGAAVGENEMLQAALASANVRTHLKGRDPDKVIARPPKLLSLVVKG